MSLFLRTSGLMRRGIMASLPRRGLNDFLSPELLAGKKMPEKVPHGRAWMAAEMRQKSYEDLHKLWYVLLKERNMLLTEKEMCKRAGQPWPSPERLHKVKLSMARLRTVVNERKKIYDYNLAEFRKNTVDAAE